MIGRMFSAALAAFLMALPAAAQDTPPGDPAPQLAAAARQVAHTIGAQAIATFTSTGSTTLRMARERPDCPVLGLTDSESSARRLSVAWGVHPVVAPEPSTMSEMVSRALRVVQAEGFAKKGDEVVVTAGVPFGVPGTTNSLRVAAVK